jgi:hypothetical protein
MQKDYLIKTIASDIEELKKSWGPAVDNDTLRRASPILRRLLIYGDLQKAWKAVGFEKELRIIAPFLEPLLDADVNHTIVAAVAGGGEFHGKIFQLFYVSEGSEPVLPPEGMDSLDEVEFGLQGFMSSCGLFLEGERVKRKSIVNYLANKLGGTHLDFKRTRKGDEQIYSLLDRHKGSFLEGEHDWYYLEVLSIGQLVSKSPDIQRFLERAKIFA